MAECKHKSGLGLVIVSSYLTAMNACLGAHSHAGSLSAPSAPDGYVHAQVSFDLADVEGLDMVSSCLTAVCMHGEQSHHLHGNCPRHTGYELPGYPELVCRLTLMNVDMESGGRRDMWWASGTAWMETGVLPNS